MPVYPHVVFATQLNNVVRAGFAGVALVDRDANVIAIAGDLASDEAMAMASLVMVREQTKIGPDASVLSKRLFRGEIIVARLERGDVAVGVAARQLFVIALLGQGDVQRLQRLRADVEAALSHNSFVPTAGSGGSGGSGPDDLALIEFGITVPRAKA